MNVNLKPDKPKFLDLHYIWKVPSSSDPSVFYICAIDLVADEGALDICSCPGFKYRQTCSHLTEARKDLDNRVKEPNEA
jgi:hypothetical protein